MIQISHGTVALRPMTRKLKKQITRRMFAGQSMDLTSGNDSEDEKPRVEVPLENLVSIAEDAFSILCESITVEGTTHTPKDPEDCQAILERLEAAGQFTDKDYDTCEEAAVELWQGKDVKKN